MKNIDINMDYGYDVLTSEGVKAWMRAVQPYRRRPVRSAGEYASVVADMLRRKGSPRIDGRLLAVGYNSVTPTEFVDTLPRWLDMWHKIAPRPNTVGSPYNPDPPDVWAAWRRGWPLVAAYCPYPGAKRTEAVRIGVAFRRSNNLPHELRWVLCKCSRRLVEALGRLCPELMRAALGTLPQDLNHLRVRDVDWAVVSATQAKLAADGSGRVRAAMAGDRRAAQVLGVTEDKLAAALVPAYPSLTLEDARIVASGVSPVQLAHRYRGSKLSRREAHQWCMDGAPWNIPRWVCMSANAPSDGIRDTKVAQWFVRQWARSESRDALCAEREMHHDGRTFHVRFIDKIDEITPEDLRPGVQATFESAAQRLGTSYLERARTSYAILCDDPWGSVSCRVRLLRTEADLALEGDEMQHCVGIYGPMVRAGGTYILSVRWGQHRSTAEVGYSRGCASVRQHRSYRNEQPHPACVAVLNSWLRRVATR